MKKILTTVTIACLALCYSDVDAGQAISRDTVSEVNYKKLISDQSWKNF